MKAAITIVKSTAVSILVLGMLSIHAFSEPANARGAAWQRAHSLAEAGHFDEARKIIEPYAMADDYEARVFVARLHAWNKDYTEAERLYRRLLLERPENLEATLGLADMLAWTRRFKEALAMLPASSTAAESAEVLMRKARYEFWSGDLGAARTDFTHLLRMSPDDRDAEAALAAMSEYKSFQLDLGYSTDDTSTPSPANAATGVLTYRSARGWTLTGGIQREQRFSETATHYLLGTSAQVGNTSLSVQYSWAAATRFFSHSDFSADIIHRLGSFSIGGGYRQLSFSGAKLRIPEAIGYAQITPAFLLDLHVVPTYTESLNAAGSWRPGALSRLTWQANQWASPFVALGFGNTASDTSANGRISYFAIRTYTAGAALRCARFQSITLSYYHEKRSTNASGDGLATGYTLRF